MTQSLEFRQQFNIVAQSARQAGSTFKDVPCLLSAIERG